MDGGCVAARSSSRHSSSRSAHWLSGRTADLSEEEVKEAYKALFCLSISLFCLEISDASFSKDSVCKRIELVFERIALVFERIAEIHSASL